MFKVNDFFCGAGGMGLGFKQAGFRLAGAWDFDKYAVESYGRNVSPKVKLMDIKEMTKDDVPHVDVWTFGFPCQDISVAGKQAGMIKGQTRSGLFYEVMRLLDEVAHKPKMILAENVKAVKSYLPEIEKEYNSRSYKMVAVLYNAKYWGVPQNRERYFIMGIRDDLEKTFEFPVEQTDFTPKLSSVLESEVDEKYYIDNEKAQKVIEQAMQRVELKSVHACITPDRVKKRQNGRRAKDEEEPMFTITAQDLHGVVFAERGRPHEGGYKVKQEFRTDNVTNTLGRNTGLNMLIEQKNLHGVIIDNKQVDKGRIYRETAPTLLSNDFKEPKLTIVDSGEKGNDHPDKTTEQYRARKLTPREYARLQAFPDSYEQVVSNSQFYKQMGNAVTVSIAKAIAEKISEFLS